MVEFYNYKFGILVKDDGTPAKKGLNLVSSKDYHALEAKLAEAERERDLWKHQHRLDTNLLRKINRGRLSDVDALTARLKDLRAEAAEYEAAILRMYFRVHNSQGDLQTALEWSKI